MKRVELTPKVIDLAELLETIASGQMVLPAFQRDFDWTEADVRELLVTVVCGWPAGSLLLVQGPTEVFHTRPFEFAPPASGEVRFSVLDGQQRLTALYHALYDLGSHVFALDWANLHDSELASVDDAVVFFRRSIWDAAFRSADGQRVAGLLPFYSLRSPSDFYDWRDWLVASASKTDQEALRQRLTSVYTTSVAQMHRYKFPVVVLESELQPQAIARIFERVNRTGIRLTAFDLMVAQTYEPQWNLRERWETARRDSSLLDRFLGDDGLPVLQTLALMYSSNVRQGAVLSLPKQLVHEKWDEAVSATERALDFLVRHCGVVDPAWLPYRAMILLLSAVALDRDLETDPELLQRWFFSRSYSLAYDVASNTRVVSDLQEVERALEGEAPLSIPSASRSVLMEATRRGQTAVWRAFLCTLVHHGARDLTGDSLGHDADTASSRDIFPQAVVPKGVLYEPNEPPPHLRALSLVLASRDTARRIRTEGLWSFFDTVAEMASVREGFKSQFLPLPEEFPRANEDWRGLLAYRLDHLTSFLEETIGQRVERDSTQ